MNPADWLRALLADLRDPDVAREDIAERYDLTRNQLSRICADNHIVAAYPPLALVGGRWIPDRAGIQRWVPDRRGAA